MKGRIFYKTYACKAKEENGIKTITGVASKMNVKDLDGDIIVSGAFDKSISERGPDSSANAKILLLADHSMSTGSVIGKITHLEEVDEELVITAQVAETQKAQEIHALIKIGAINQMSVGFRFVEGKFEEIETGFLFKEVALVEISVVTLGANEQTSLEAKGLEILGVEKSKAPKIAKEINTAIAKVLADNGVQANTSIEIQKAITAGWHSPSTHQSQKTEESTETQLEVIDFSKMDVKRLLT